MSENIFEKRRKVLEKAKRIIALMSVIGVCLTPLYGCSSRGNSIPEEVSSSPELIVPEESILEKGTFISTDEDSMGGFGSVQIRGYATALKTEPWSESCNSEEDFYYVMFNILETENQDFLNFIEEALGNSFVEENAIGLGHLLQGAIHYYNFADETGEKYYEISEDDTNEIMDSTIENPIVLELTRLKSTTGGCAPDCYSHISEVKIKLP